MSSLDLLPTYLKKYVVAQDYERYTPIEHATWRFIMRQARNFFSEHAVDIYVQGLDQTGIPIDRIPRISEMDEQLQKFGWGAVGVEGFIPSSVFLDLLARGIMPIACDMRTLEHIGYTPAPDIVHEAAGHAPIVADPAYREFLNRYAQMAYRALISAEDVKLYEAIRYLSDIKENPDIHPEEINRAKMRLDEVSSNISYLSEAGKVARMAWWTIEYGLVGPLDQPKIYGAGLLSSIDESKNCLSNKVRKIPLTVDCVHQTYDITEPQPQLFVAKSLDHLPGVLEELEGTFAFKRGGKFSLEEMQRADTINTIQFETNVMVSGRLQKFEFSERFGVESISLSEEGQISVGEIELPGFGRKRFPDGLATPLGRWQQYLDTPSPLLTDEQLTMMGIIPNKNCKLSYANGYVVEGVLTSWQRVQGKLALLHFSNAQVTRGDHCLFHSSHDPFTLIVGENVESVFAGPADRNAYGDYYVGEASTTPGRRSPYTPEERRLFELFSQVRQLRDGTFSQSELSAGLQAVTNELMATTRPNWLLALEVAELAETRLKYRKNKEDWLERLHHNVLQEPSRPANEVESLIARGLNLLNVTD